VVKKGKVELLLIGGTFFGGGGNIYRHRELKRGGDVGVFKMSKLKLQSFHLAFRLLSPCSQVALFQYYLLLKDGQSMEFGL
jgi:hypothetical protein